MAHITQVAVCASTQGVPPDVVALDSEGNVWQYIPALGQKWQKLPSLPEEETE